MTKAQMIEKVNEIQELTELLTELKAEISSLEDEIKAEMNAQAVEVLDLDTYFVRFTSVLSSRFDTKRFKEHFGEGLYKEYCKEVPSRRFTISVAKTNGGPGADPGSFFFYESEKLHCRRSGTRKVFIPERIRALFFSL